MRAGKAAEYPRTAHGAPFSRSMLLIAQAGLPAAAWAEVPFDIMREVVGRLSPHDVQTTLLVCREWRDGFTHGVVALRPRVLRPRQLAERCAA